jgi:hypothetical protein
VQKHENAGEIAARNDEPLAGHSVEVHGSKFDILCHGPDGADLVEALASCDPTHRSRLRREYCTNCIDFTHTRRPHAAGIPSRHAERRSSPDVAAVAGAQRNRRQAVIDRVAPMNAIGSAQPNKP